MLNEKEQKKYINNKMHFIISIRFCWIRWIVIRFGIIMNWNERTLSWQLASKSKVYHVSQQSEIVLIKSTLLSDCCYNRWNRIQFNWYRSRINESFNCQRNTNDVINALFDINKRSIQCLQRFPGTFFFFAYISAISNCNEIWAGFRLSAPNTEHWNNWMGEKRIN